MGDERNLRRLRTICANVPEESRIKLDEVIRRFQANHKLTDFTFPSTLTSHERAYIHAQVGIVGLKSQSNGGGQNRRITISKAMGNSKRVMKTIELCPKSLIAIRGISNKGAGLLPSPKARHCQPDEVIGSEDNNGYANRLFTQPPPMVPQKPKSSKFEESKRRLPIYRFKDKILDVIKKHAVVFIKGSTGCGKTTQVPQYIMEQAAASKTPVRIVCTVPRRIAAISISDRVAAERGEQVGRTVGYQIRLEHCVNPNETVLTYCTSGILLRSLTTSDYSILKNTSHIIIDEVHERDRQTEFLLACLKDAGRHFSNMKIILMGADMNVESMTSYFGGPSDCPVIQVEGRLFPVSTYFLEQTLEMLKYDATYSRHKKGIPNKSHIMSKLVDRLKDAKLDQVTTCQNARSSSSSSRSAVDSSEVDSLIIQVWSCGDNTSFRKFVNLVEAGNISVNHRHQEQGVTMLMAVCVRGDLQYLNELLDLGSDINVSDNRYFTAKTWAADHEQEEAVRILEEYECHQALAFDTGNQNLNDDMKSRLENYQNTVDDERVDLCLIVSLIQWIHTHSPADGAILIFLPGYDDIITLKQLIFSHTELERICHHFCVFQLHSNIQSGDQRAVFELPPRGKRKIVLSTNIAETSLTIEDIVFVIDSGKVKEKTFDSMTGVTQLKSNWISKASANQRHGRAGRCREGTCFRLYSRSRYESFTQFPIAEIIRSSLQELCLYTRGFIRKDKKIMDFFSRLPESPAPIAVRKSIDSLISIGALDSDEQLTQLGTYLLDLPVEPYLGRALLYAVTLKCLDPVLTLVAIMSHREPFQLPANADEKAKAMDSKIAFMNQTLSDHMSALRAFQEWEVQSQSYDGGRQFCRERYVSSATFDMVYGIRRQLLAQLRNAGFLKDIKSINANSDNWSLVKGILTATLFPNVCCVDRENKCLFHEFDKKTRFHTGSAVMAKRKTGFEDLPSDWIIYDEMCQQEFVKSVRNSTFITDIHLAVFAGSFTIHPVAFESGLSATADKENCGEGEVCVETSKRFDLNTWISFRGSDSIIDSVLHVRQCLDRLVKWRLNNPGHRFSEDNEMAVKTIANIMSWEDDARGFSKVGGVEQQWPMAGRSPLRTNHRAGFQRRRK